MTTLSRRTMIAGAGIGALAAASGVPWGSAHAQSEGAAAKPSPGFYRYKLGSFEVTVVTDGARPGPLPDQFARNATKEELNGALEAAFLQKDQFTNTYTPMVVNTGSKLVVIDTGNGPRALQQTQGQIGRFGDNLIDSGIKPEDVTTVIISHFHSDHIGGLLTADEKPAFPNAEVFVPAGEWAFWMDDGAMSRAPDAAKGAFANARRVFAPFGDKITKYEAGKDVLPGISAIATPGHTPGHVSHIVASGDASLLVQADVATAPYFFVRHPEWHVMFDMDPVMAEETRRKLYDRVVADRLLLHGFHFPFPGTGHLEKDGAGYRFVPVYWGLL